MYFDLLLLSVIMVAGLLAPGILRRHPRGQRGFAWLLVADGACAVVSLVLRHGGGGPFADLLGFVALGAAFFLVVVPSVLQELVRRALLADRLGLAYFLFGFWDLLQPGMGAREERDRVAAILAMRASGLENEIEILEQARKQLTRPGQRRSLDTRLLLLLLTARRWAEAVAAFERSQPDSPPPPQLLVEVMRAYGELDDIDNAARLMQEIEDSDWAKESVVAALVARARLLFLSFAGRARDVETLLAPGGTMGAIPDFGRYFWLGVAYLNAGEKESARAQFESLVEITRDNPATNSYVAGMLDAVERAKDGPRQVTDRVAELADLVAERVKTMPIEAGQRMPRMIGVGVATVPVTAILCACNLLVFALVLFGFGSTGDPGVLARVGANVKSAVWFGEWWRLTTSMFLHMGLVHLLFNLSGLWVLGKLVEQIHGSTRMFAIYMMTGLAGALASALFGGPAMSAGASGGILGLLGAVIGDLVVARSAYPPGWRKSLLGRSLFVAAAMVVIGWFYEAIDQSAHLGGLGTGVLLGILLSPNSAIGWSWFTRVLCRLLLLTSAVMLGYGLYGVASTDYRDTLARYGTAEFRLPAGLSFYGPTVWQMEGPNRVRDPFMITLVEVDVIPRSAGSVKSMVEAVLRREESTAGTTRVPEHARLPVPEPWHSRELYLVRDQIGGEQHFRMVFLGREAEHEMWLVTLVFPDALTADLQPTFEELLRSLHRWQ